MGFLGGVDAIGVEDRIICNSEEKRGDHQAGLRAGTQGMRRHGRSEGSGRSPPWLRGKSWRTAGQVGRNGIGEGLELSLRRT